MSRTQRITALLLVLVLPILAACGGGNATPTPSGGAGASASAVPSGANSASSASPVASASASGGASASASASGGGASASASASASGGASPSASGSGSSSGATTAAAFDFSKLQVEDGATLNVTSWGDAAELEINNAAIERFKEVFPNVTINYTPRPEQYQTSVQGDFAAGLGPDVLYVDGALFRQLAPNNQLLDLKPTMDKLGVSNDVYVPSLFELFTSDGKVLGVPKDSGALGLFINNRLAQEAGVTPANIKTWDDWKAAAQAMTKNGVFGQCGSNDINRIGALMLQKGVTPVSNGQANLAQPGAQQALDFWYGLQRDKFAALPADVGANWCGVAFGQEQTAMAVEGGWLFPTMQKDYSGVDYTTVQLPTPPDGKPGNLLFTNAWGVSANTKFPQAAAALALFFTSPQNQQQILQTGFALPSVQALLKDPYFEQNPNAQALAAANEYGTPAATAFGGFTKQDDVIKAINTSFESLFLGSGDPASVLQQANQEVQSVVSQ